MISAATLIRPPVATSEDDLPTNQLPQPTATTAASAADHAPVPSPQAPGPIPEETMPDHLIFDYFTSAESEAAETTRGQAAYAAAPSPRCHRGPRRRLPCPHPARVQRDRARHRPRTALRWHRAHIPKGPGRREAHRRARDPPRHLGNTHRGNPHRGRTHPGNTRPGRVDPAARVSHQDRRPSSSTGREAGADQAATRRGPAEKGLDPSDHEAS